MRFYILPIKQISDNSSRTCYRLPTKQIWDNWGHAGDIIKITDYLPSTCSITIPRNLMPSQFSIQSSCGLQSLTSPYSNAPLPRPLLLQVHHTVTHKHNTQRWSKIIGLRVSMSLYVDFNWNDSREKSLQENCWTLHPRTLFYWTGSHDLNIFLNIHLFFIRTQYA